jgi:excisionase family DNA binding protein
MENNQQVGQSENLPQQLLTVAQVAYRLHISKSHCYLLLQRGFIPNIRLGKSRRVLLQDLQDYISRNRFSSNNN